MLAASTVAGAGWAHRGNREAALLLFGDTRRWFARWAFAGELLVLVPSFLFAAGRLVAHDRLWPMVLWDTFTFWVYLPAYLALVSCLVFRRWLLAPVALFVIGWHIAWVLPDYDDAEPIPPGAAEGPRFRVFAANVLEGTGDVAAIAEEAASAGADVAVFVEFSADADRIVEQTSFASAYPERVGGARDGFFGNVIYSRLELDHGETWMAGPTPESRVTVTVGGRTVRLYGIHTIAPVTPGAFKGWNENFEALLDQVKNESGPLALVGDFNLTQNHRWYDELIDAGFTDCHHALGKGTATTWPNGTAPLPPIRLDQVFVRGGLACLAIREGEGQDSDHRPIIVDLGFAP